MGAVVSSAMIIVAHLNNDWIAPLSAGSGSGISTEEVRGLLRALPTIICVSIGFNLCYGGMDIYQLQACQMDTRTGFPDGLNDFFFLGSGQFNGVFYGLGDNASIIICIPLLEILVFPALKRMRGGVPVSRMAKFNVGFFFAILGCVVGIVIELIRRKKELITCTAEDTSCFCGIGVGTNFKANYAFTNMSSCNGHDGQWLLVSNCAPKGVPMSMMSAWWTFIPYWVTGMGEILVNPVIQEFSFDEVAPSLKSLLMGITMVVTGCIPSVISGALGGFIPNNLNLGDVNVVYIVFIVLSLVLLVVYWMIALPERTGHHESRQEP